MVAEFYIIAESFTQNAASSKEQIEIKIEALGSDFINIRKHKETNKLFINPEIYNISFINNVSISDLLYNDEISNENIDRDARNMLKKIVMETETNSITSKEVIEVLLPEHNEELCHGLIAFNSVDGVNPEFQIVYNEKGWLKFRRHYLGLYPKNEEFFILECRKYFPNIIFHNNTINSISSIFNNFPKKIIYHLEALNDRFKESEDGFRHRQQVLTHFSGNCNLDTTASLEGNADKKPLFTYEFVDSEGNNQSVCCEPHIKLCTSDTPGDNTYYQNRIYFHEGFENIEENKILIGHIGGHL